MSLDLNKKHASIIRCDFSFMNRGRLWCSWKTLFRHWTWLIAYSLVGFFLHSSVILVASYGRVQFIYCSCDLLLLWKHCVIGRRVWLFVDWGILFFTARGDIGISKLWKWGTPVWITWWIAWWVKNRFPFLGFGLIPQMLSWLCSF